MKLLLERKMNRVYFYLHRIGSLPSLSAERNLILWGVSYSSQGSFQGSFFGGQWGPVIVGNVSDLECVCKCSVFFLTWNSFINGATLVACELYIEISIFLGPCQLSQSIQKCHSLCAFSMLVWNDHRFSNLLAAITELDLRDMVRVMHSQIRGHCNI